jgi:hypothetical protein
MKRRACSIFLIGLGLAAQTGGAGADSLLTTRGEPVLETRHDVKVSAEDGLATLTEDRQPEPSGFRFMPLLYRRR